MKFKLTDVAVILTVCVLFFANIVYAKSPNKASNLTVVALSGTEYSSPVDALVDINKWCGLPSATNPCLIKLMPGVYSLNAPITLIPHVDLVGSGTGNTTITAADFNAIEGDSASVTIADLSIESNEHAIYMSIASELGVFTITNVNAKSLNRGAVYIRNNDAAIIVDNCVLTGRDGPLGFHGTNSVKTLNVNIRSTEFLRSDPAYLPESAVFGSNAHSITINDVKIVGYLENFQIGRIDKVNVSRLDGVGYFNFPASVDVTVRDSRLSNTQDSGPVPIVWGVPSYGPIKVVNTMLVGGTDATVAEATLLNCFDENLQLIILTN